MCACCGAQMMVRVLVAAAVPYSMLMLPAQVCEAVYVAGEPLLPPALRGGPRDPTKVRLSWGLLA